MKKGYFWLVMLAICCIIAAVMVASDGRTESKFSFKEVNDRSTVENWEDLFVDYGDFVVNWNRLYGSTLYEVVYKDGTHRFETLEAIAEMVVNSGPTEYFK